MSQKEQKSYIYATAANGLEVRIPADKYPEWKAAQDRQRRGESTAEPQMAKELLSLMKGEQKNPNTSENKEEKLSKEAKIMNIITSKRIAAVISIILCAVLYFALLANVFTEKRDTYICYTTKTGECYHAATCKYASKTAYETTVYEVCREYKPCSYCNPCGEQYKATITEKNYIAPLVISLPLSAAVFLVLVIKKKSPAEKE